MLTYAIPRKDVKPIAKGLIKQFGSLRGVLDASFEDLCAFDGLSENSATYLKALRECSTLYLREKVHKSNFVISSASELLNYCKVAMGSLRDEQFRAVFLNTSNEVICDEVIQEGTVNQAVVYPRKVMERALHHKATALIFIHNHPGGNCKPSQDDRIITAELVRVAKSLQIAVHDHIIICPGSHFSFRDRGLL